jgi:serine/threonine-protein kinase
MTMHPAVGSRLGPYEITGPLGAGGMGEVYRAKDTRLDRSVAVKILPSHLSDDAHLRQRFEREAKLISSLNHPHVCALYDVGRQDGIDYLVMELLEGETLAQRLTKGPLSLDLVLSLGIQIADALDKVHRQGIVHRDLKPGNIMLTRSGAKLLDFGLAKASLPRLDDGATAAAPVTQEGAVIGTFPYMSPEQMRGNPVDSRSDLFSFGSVLYEMLTGRRAFAASDAVGVASAVIEKEPAPMGTILPSIPPALDRAVRRCLAKDPEERWQSARDLLLELEWISESDPRAGEGTLPASRSRSRELLAWSAALVLAIATVVAGMAWWRTRGRAPLLPRMELSMELPSGNIIDRFRGGQPAVSPDGTRTIVIDSDWAGNYSLAMRALDQDRFVHVPGADGGGMPFFSPDGQWFGFSAGDKLKKLPLQGGAPVTLCDVGPFPGGASWGDDGTIVFSRTMVSPSGLVGVSSAGGAVVPVTQIDPEKGEVAHVWPQVLPGSRSILFTTYVQSGSSLNGDGRIDVFDRRTGERKVVVPAGAFGRYLASGHLVYVLGTTLWAVPFDLADLTVHGAAQPVLEGVNGDAYHGGEFACSDTGTLAYVSSNVSRTFAFSLWWLDANGRTEPLHTPPGLYENPHFSPDGKHLAFEVALAGSRADIWVKDLERDTVSKVTHLPGRNNWPLWTPDGKGLVFTSSDHAAEGLYWTRADGSSSHRLLEYKTDMPIAGSFTPDGKRLAYYQASADRSHLEIRTAAFETSGERPVLGESELFTKSSSSEALPLVSPDGGWIAYMSEESGKAEVYVRKYPGPGGKVQVSSGGGSHPIWSLAEPRLYFLSPDLRIMEVEYPATSDVFAPTKPRVWSERRLASLGGCYPYDLAPDGKRFAVVLNPGDEGGLGRNPTDSVLVVLNFFDELRRKFPAGGN